MCPRRLMGHTTVGTCSAYDIRDIRSGLWQQRSWSQLENSRCNGLVRKTTWRVTLKNNSNCKKKEKMKFKFMVYALNEYHTLLWRYEKPYLDCKDSKA